MFRSEQPVTWTPRYSLFYSTVDIRNIIDIMDIMDSMDIMDIMIITAWMGMAGAVSALVCMQSEV